MSRHDDLIQSLSSGLKPVKPVPSPDRLALVWLLLSAVYVVLITWYFGPLREGALQQLFSVPRFFIETASGLLGIGLVGVCAFRAAVPGRLSKSFATASFVVLGIWLSQYFVGLAEPALAPSMLGERAACWAQTAAFAIPPMAIAFVLTRRLYPLNPWRTTLCFCLAAGMLPALYMQLACVYVVPHILEFHILPGLLIALAGSTLAVFYRAR